MKKIAFAGRWSPLDQLAWSGTYFASYKAIRQNFTVDFFHYKWPFYIREYLILHKKIQQLRNKKVAVEFLTGYAKYFSKQLEKDLKGSAYDAIFVPSAPQLIAYCKTDIPIIYLTDATFIQLQGYYPSFQNLASYNIKQGITMDKNCFHKAAHCMLASGWNEASAIKDYGVDASKISVVPLGANLDEKYILKTIPEKQTKECRLLFVGVEWERKGGQIVLAAYEQLKKEGLAVTLHIIGCVPPVPVHDKGVTVIPFLNKHDPEQLAHLHKLFAESSFLFLPSRAECAGVVFCEASAFGLPSISTDTGGISTYVQHGRNGYLLALEANAKDYAAIIQAVFADKTAYQQLCVTSRNLYEEKLNWNNWGMSFKNIVDQLS